MDYTTHYWDPDYIVPTKPPVPTHKPTHPWYRIWILDNDNGRANVSIDLNRTHASIHIVNGRQCVRGGLFVAQIECIFHHTRERAFLCNRKNVGSGASSNSVFFYLLF